MMMAHDTHTSGAMIHSTPTSDDLQSDGRFMCVAAACRREESLCRAHGDLAHLVIFLLMVRWPAPRAWDHRVPAAPSHDDTIQIPSTRPCSYDRGNLLNLCRIESESLRFFLYICSATIHLLELRCRCFRIIMRLFTAHSLYYDGEVDKDGKSKDVY